ncbi:protein SFI1 homolog isoform X2 [Takifugu flavidus]|uniref:protein SFI1 homolog isoform X2 n=1 Tax=Takifugu flavidus TaxID=433684 RepID=UPI0025444760|nr:protein SFI1 homolog isoform X2 [Takifugu flavidus]
MQSNSKRADSGRTQTVQSVSSIDELKQVRKGPATKIPYRDEYGWNKGGRLKELIKTHLARKYLKIWMLKTFGRILPHAAKSHHQSVVLRRAFGGWKDEWWTSRKEWCQTTLADCHYRYYLYNLAFQHWRTFVSLQKEKKNKVQCAVQFAHRQLLRLTWNRWETLKEMRMKKRMFESVLDLKRLKTLQSAWHVWQKRLQQHQNLQVLKQRRASQQRMLDERWKLWQDCLEEAEYKNFQPLREMALIKHSTCLQRSCFNQWREKLGERRRLQELRHQVDVYFAEHMLPSCFKTWAELTLQRRLHKQRKHQADVYNQQRLRTWVFYTWWAHTETHKDQMLSERIAVVHEERNHLQRAWRRWQEKVNDRQRETKERQTASSQLYMDTMLCKTVTQWEENSPEIQDRRRQGQQACHQSGLHGRKWAVGKCKQKCCLRVHQFSSHTAELCRQQAQNTLRYVMSVWRDKAMLQREFRLMEQEAQNHYQYFLQFKVFIAWREETASAVSACRQQREALTRFQMFQNKVRLLQCFRQWKEEAAHARSEKTNMERARWHHESKLLSKAMKTWNEHHNQFHTNKVMKRQGMFLLRLKMYQKCFDLWKVKLQHRRREAELTERALWHWSLTLQAKVLCGWRRWVTELQLKQEQAAGAARTDRGPLMEDVKCCLTSAAHMKDLTAGLAEDSQEQESLCLQKRSHRRLHRVVRSCVLRWKQRALCKPNTVQELKEDPQKKKKSVTFGCMTPERTIIPPTDSLEQEDEFKELRNLLAHRPQGLLESPLANVHDQSAFTDTTAPPEPAGSHLHPVCSIHHTLNSSRSDLVEGSSSSFSQSSAFPNIRVRENRGPTQRVDPASFLIPELLSIQQDMESYQQDRKQLRAWKKLKAVLQSWKQTSGRYDQSEKAAVCQEMKELEERIARLSAELAKEKPRILLHAERIQHLQTVLRRHSVLTASH